MVPMKVMLRILKIPKIILHLGVFKLLILHFSNQYRSPLLIPMELFGTFQQHFTMYPVKFTEYSFFTTVRRGETIDSHIL